MILSDHSNKIDASGKQGFAQWQTSVPIINAKISFLVQIIYPSVSKPVSATVYSSDILSGIWLHFLDVSTFRTELEELDIVFVPLGFVELRLKMIHS